MVKFDSPLISAWRRQEAVSSAWRE